MARGKIIESWPPKEHGERRAPMVLGYLSLPIAAEMIAETAKFVMTKNSRRNQLI